MFVGSTVSFKNTLQNVRDHSESTHTYFFCKKFEMTGKEGLNWFLTSEFGRNTEFAKADDRGNVHCSTHMVSTLAAGLRRTRRSCCATKTHQQDKDEEQREKSEKRTKTSKLDGDGDRSQTKKLRPHEDEI